MILLVSAAVVLDFKTWRIPNWLVLIGMETGIFVTIQREGWRMGGIQVVLGIVLPIALLFLLFQFGFLGAGDIKLLSVIGSMIGPTKILNCISYSFLIGAVISAALMISSGIVCQRIHYLLHYISAYFKTGKREPYYKSGMPLENFHFTVPIFLSALLYAGGVY